MKKRTRKNKESSIIKRILISVLFSFLLLFFFSFILSIILSTFDDPTKNIKIYSLAVFLITAAASGFIFSALNKERGITVSLIASLIFICAVLIISTVRDTSASPLSRLMNALCYILISVFFAFLGTKRKRTGRRH